MHGPVDLCARAAARRPGSVLAAGLVLAALAALPFAVRGARGEKVFEQDLFALLPPDIPEVKTFLDFRERFEPKTPFYVILEASGDDRAERLERFADEMAPRLERSPRIGGVEHRLPESFRRFATQVFDRNRFLFLEPQELEETLADLEPERLRASAREGRERLASAAPLHVAELVRADPFSLLPHFAPHLGRMGGGYKFDFLSGYYLAEDHGALLVRLKTNRSAADIPYGLALAQDVAEAAAATRRARSAEAGPAAADVRVRVTGWHLVAAADAAAIRSDMLGTTIGSGAAVLVLFYLGFRRASSVLFAGVPLLLSVGYTYGFFLATRGPLSLGGAGMAAILIGLGIDLPIHLLNRFVIEERKGRRAAEAVEAAVRATGPSLAAAALTTAVAFASFAATDFRALADLGYMAAAGILFCLGTMLTVMPALLLLASRGRPPGPAGLALAMGPLARAIERRPLPWLLASALAFAASLAAAGQALSGGLPVETDMKNLRPEGGEALETLEAVARRFGGSFESVFGMHRARGEEELAEQAGRLRGPLDALCRDGVLAGYEGLAKYLPAPSLQRRNIERLSRVDARATAADAREALRLAGFKEGAFDGYLARLEAALAVREPIGVGTLRGAGLEEVVDRFVREGEGGKEQLAAVYLFPRREPSSAAERQELRRAIEAATGPSGVPLELTGAPMVLSALVDHLKRDIGRATAIAAALIALTTWVHFRSLRLAALALAPVTLGFAALVAVMDLLEVKLNFMNVAVFPMILGLGVDDGIHIVTRYFETRERSVVATLADAGRAVLLTSLTTIAGFGSLAFASWRGLRSFGIVTSVGMTTCLVASVVLLPALLALLYPPPVNAAAALPSKGEVTP